MDSSIQMEEQEPSNKEDLVQIDINEIDCEIRSHGKYEFEDKYFIKLFNPLKQIESLSDSEIKADLSQSVNSNSDAKDQSNKYIANIKSSFEYTGILSSTLTKEVFGLNNYSQGDSYLGEWKNDIKEGVGMYSYKLSSSKQSMYIGNWEKGAKQGKGILYILQPTGSQSQESCEVFIGQFINDKFVEGITFKHTFKNQTHKEAIIYIGKYNSKGLKQDSNAMLIQSNVFLFNLDLTEETIAKGWLMNFKEGKNDELANVFYFKRECENQFSTTSFEGLEKEIQEYVEFKNQLNIQKILKKQEEYMLLVNKIKNEFSDITHYQMNYIEEAIKIFNDNQLSLDKIIRPEPIKIDFDKSE